TKRSRGKVSRTEASAIAMHGRFPPMSRSTLWSVFESNYQRQNRSCKSTAKQYRVQLLHYGRWLGHEPTLDDLTDDLLSSFLDAHAEGRAAPTANKAYW